MITLPTGSISEDIAYGIVAYTDGGARPNPGMIGSGVHGYIWSSETPKQGSGLSTHHITKTGYIAKSDKSKDIVQITPIAYIDIFEPSSTPSTNNVAELKAMILLLKEITNNLILVTPNIRSVLVNADSEYVKKGIQEFMPVWKKRNWCKASGEPINNLEFWKEVDELIQELSKKDISLEINWIKGHSENLGNEIADELATIGVAASAKQITTGNSKFSNAKSYWNKEVPKHPFFNYGHLYFNSVKEANEEGVYYMGDPGSGNPYHGKKTPETTYAVLKLKKPDPLVEFIRDYQCKQMDGVNKVFTIDMNNLHSKAFYFKLLEHKEIPLMVRSIRPNDLNYLDRAELTREQNPTGLTLRAVENLNLLESALANVDTVTTLLKEKSNLIAYENIVDITDVFYHTVTTKKKGEEVSVVELKPEFKVGHAGADIKMFNCEKPFEIPVRFGYDLLDRNNMKRLEEENPKVYLVIWKMSELSFKYATVVKCDSGEGIWSNYFANNVIIKDEE